MQGESGLPARPEGPYRRGPAWTLPTEGLLNLSLARDLDMGYSHFQIWPLGGGTVMSSVLSVRVELQG